MSNQLSSVLTATHLKVIRGGSSVLEIPDLTVYEGERLVIIGPNGAGKSTLLQTLSALIKPSNGEIYFKERKIGFDIPVLEYRRRLAMVLQEPLLFNTTVYNNVASGLQIRGVSKTQIKPVVERTLTRFGLDHLKDRSAKTLSGGEARRVSIARAFAVDPEILLLDEPFSALDPIIREALIEDLDRLLRETRLTTIFVTHNRGEAFRLGSRIGIMDAGKILQIGSPEEVMDFPVNAIAASLIGIENILPGEVISENGKTMIVQIQGKRFEVAGRLGSGMPVFLCIRPDHIKISREVTGCRIPEKNHFSSTIEKIIPMGFYSKVKMNCGFPLVAYVSDYTVRSLSLKEGEVVIAGCKTAAVKPLPAR
jgi:tungstate transport system ATP-binding protein